MLYSPTIQPDEYRQDTPSGHVWLTELTVNGFRNYDHLSVSLDHRPVILTGPNGAGKTNLMEAVSLLAPGRGLRRARVTQMARQSRLAAANGGASTAWSVAVRMETPDGPFQAGTGITDDPAGHEPSRRLIRIDGETASQTQLAERVAVSWLTPEMDQVLGAPPSERRRFLDRLVIAFDPAHSGRLQRYDKASRQRNRLLDENRGDATWLEALEAEMAASGVAILAARMALVEALEREASLPVPVFPSARLHLEGEAEEWMQTMPAIDVEDRIRMEAKAARQRGEKSIPGASASVLVATHSGTGQDAELSSTGEQKALVISVILAHARLQSKRLRRPPILLLDDIASHLDERRRNALFDLTGELAGQVWFSGTDEAIFETLIKTGQHIPIAAGRMVPSHADGE